MLHAIWFSDPNRVIANVILLNIKGSLLFQGKHFLNKFYFFFPYFFSCLGFTNIQQIYNLLHFYSSKTIITQNLKLLWWICYMINPGNVKLEKVVKWQEGNFCKWSILWIQFKMWGMWSFLKLWRRNFRSFSWRNRTIN